MYGRRRERCSEIEQQCIITAGADDLGMYTNVGHAEAWLSEVNANTPHPSATLERALGAIVVI